jgi:DNA modification methylase
MTKWLYGDAWEQFPIEEGEIWAIGNSKVAVHNIFNPLPDFMHNADLIFVDPPWNLGNINSFYTKAGRNDYLDSFDDFSKILFKRICDINPNTAYIEIGKQNIDNWYKRLISYFPFLHKWEVTYYKKHLTYIIRGSKLNLIDYNFSGIDEAKCINIISKIENYNTIGDLCMGKGLVGIAAYNAGKNFVGTELNKRRLANLLQKLSKYEFIERSGYKVPEEK